MTSEERNGLVLRLKDFDHNVDIQTFYEDDFECVSEAADQIEADGQRIAELEAANVRLCEALQWMECYEPGVIEAIRMRVGEKRDLPKCFGSIDVAHPQSRAENCCDDCPAESHCRAALGDKQ